MACISNVQFVCFRHSCAVLLYASFPGSSGEFDKSTDPELEERQRISVDDTHPHAVFSYIR